VNETLACMTGYQWKRCCSWCHLFLSDGIVIGLEF